MMQLDSLFWSAHWSVATTFSSLRYKIYQLLSSTQVLLDLELNVWKHHHLMVAFRLSTMDLNWPYIWFICFHLSWSLDQEGANVYSNLFQVYHLMRHIPNFWTDIHHQWLPAWLRWHIFHKIRLWMQIDQIPLCQTGRSMLWYRLFCLHLNLYQISDRCHNTNSLFSEADVLLFENRNLINRHRTQMILCMRENSVLLTFFLEVKILRF